MRFSVSQVISHLNLTSQAKLKVMNTFFALTIATYYVFVHHTPKVLRWSLPFTLYAQQEKGAEQKVPLALSLPLLASSPHPLFASGNFLTPLPPAPSSTPLAILPRESTRVVALQHADQGMNTVLSLIRHKVRLTPRQISSIVIARQDTVLTKPSSKLTKVWIATPCPPPTWGWARNDAGGKLLGTEKTRLLKKALRVASPIPQLPLIPPLLVLPRESASTVPLQRDEEVISAAIPLTRNKIPILTAEPALPLEEEVQTAAIPTPSAPTVALQPWHTYIVTSNNPLLRFWLMKLAPGSTIAPEEIPFRKALIKTLLLPKFQSYVGLAWEEEDALDMQQRRGEFCRTYLKAVDWAATPFERLFLTEAEDWHQVNEPAYGEGYDFPLKLGVRVYKDEDFPCDHSGFHAS